MKPLLTLSRPIVPVVLPLLTACFAASSRAADAVPTLTPAIREEVVESLGQLLQDIYVIPETATRLQELTRSRLADGAYDGLDADAFAAQLTEDLQGLSGDRHLRVSFGEKMTPMIVKRGEPGPGTGGSQRIIVREPGGAPTGSTPTDEGPAGGPRRIVRKAGEGGDGGVFDGRPGIHDAEILPGNIGLVRIDLFKPLAMEEEAAVRAMETVADTDALIFDLRSCAGGTPEMVHFITSYLYPPERKHLLTYYHAREAPDSAYTVDVPGTHMPDVPVYILTSPFTASGGEEFTYVLKHHGRATVVGEKTAGGGHGGGIHPVAAGFHAFIPDFRPVHPVTGGGWEGVGVVPDRECTSHQALLFARKEAITQFAENAEGKRRAELEALRTTLEAEVTEASAPFDKATHAEYAGRYGIRTITIGDDGLYLQRTGRPKLLLVPVDGQDEFTLAVLSSAKIRFSRDADGAIAALHVLNMQGEWEVAHRETPRGAG